MGLFLPQIKVLLYMNEFSRRRITTIVLYLLERQSLTLLFNCLSCTPETLIQRKSIVWINDGTIQGCTSRSVIHISDTLMVCS